MLLKLHIVVNKTKLDFNLLKWNLLVYIKKTNVKWAANRHVENIISNIYTSCSSYDFIF